MRQSRTTSTSLLVYKSTSLQLYLCFHIKEVSISTFIHLSKRYTHKTSDFKTSGFKTSGFKTPETSGFQNVRFTKRQVVKTSGLQNIRLQKKHSYIFCTCGWWKSAGSVAAMFAVKVMAVFYSLL
jgi:hypothetical protein